MIATVLKGHRARIVVANDEWLDEYWVADTPILGKEADGRLVVRNPFEPSEVLAVDDVTERLADAPEYPRRAVLLNILLPGDPYVIQLDIEDTGVRDSVLRNSDAATIVRKYLAGAAADSSLRTLDASLVSFFNFTCQSIHADEKAGRA